MKLAVPANPLIAKIATFPKLPELLAVLAGLHYLIQSIGFAYTQWSVIDEGSYAYKGWLFATGQYVPFQDYGVWTNHMPFSFLILGAVQFLFGPGIRTIRYFMIFMGCMMLLALWLTSRRLAGKWAAALCVWFVALNPFPISDYSVGIAEGPVACILAWTLCFTLGENRSKKALVTGALFAAALVLTRENMVLLLPFLFAYVFWQNGKKTGLLFAGTTLGALLIVHAIYWPGIIRIWVTWMPKSIRPLFGSWVYQGIGRLDEPSNASLQKNLLIVFSAIQNNFLAVFSALAVWLSWPRGGFKNPTQFKLVVSLSVILVVLLLGHAWASLTKTYCSFCLVNYITFFSPVALLLFFAFLPSIHERKPLLPIWLVGLVIVLLAAGIGYGNYDRFGVTLTTLPFPRKLALPLETVEIWRMIYNKFGFDRQDQRQILPVVAGFVAGGFIVILGALLARLNKNLQFVHGVYAVTLVTLITGAVLSPTLVMGGVVKTCDQDVLSNYEKIGAQLAARIPPGAQIYWRGDASPISLLYVHDVKIYPPQLNGLFAFRPEPDRQSVLRFGFWNTQLDQEWLASADIFLVRDALFYSLQALLATPQFRELEKTDPVFACSPDTSIRIFERKRK